MKQVSKFLFIFSVSLLSVSVSATTWYPVVDDSFTRADTATSSTPGSTSGAGNGWIDTAGGMWNISNNQLQGSSYASSDYLTKFLLRPSSENKQDQRIIATLPAGENFGQFLGLVLRYQSGTNDHYLAHIGSGGIFVYKIVGGVTTSLGTTALSLNNSIGYSIEFSATSTNATVISVIVRNLADNSLVGTFNTTDSSATLQGSGSSGLSTWYNSGVHFVHSTRVQTYSATPPANFSIVGADTVTGTANVAMPITDVQISGNGASTTPVKLRVTSGTLAMSNTTGLTFTGGTTGSTLYFSGTVTDINNALSTLTYTRASTGSDTLEVSLVPSGEVFFADNGHLYEYISSTLTWQGAQAAAASLTKYGATGYLTTITSQQENDFVAARLSNAGWMGASDSAVEGAWKWATGPETGTQFWSGASGGSTFGGNYANWGTGEPNDAGSNEDCGQFLSGGSGKWNDLPCTGTTLPGYVVEYGALGALPTVIAKNVSISTTNAPSISSLTPADNSTGVATSTNLTMLFSTTVYASTSDITIYKTADNTVFETINVASSTVTGSGTNTIVVNPVNDFQEGVGYYVMIPSTAFRDGSHAYFAGVNASTSWNFTMGDTTAPVITSVSATSTSSTSASITWSTNENASSRVYYGVVKFSSSTAETDTSPRVTSHSIALTNLVPCSTYYYKIVSRDGYTNTATSSDDTFKTIGCEASVVQTSATSTDVTVSATTTTQLTEGGATFMITTPANFTSTSSNVIIQIQSLPGNPVIGLIGKPTSTTVKVGDIVFDVKAIINSNVILDSFALPVTITYTYSDADIAGLDEATLRLYHYANGEWSALNDCSVNTSTNTITCTAPHFSIFSLFGQTLSAGASAQVGPGAGGSSIAQQVEYLYKMGKKTEAEQLKKKWPQLFAEEKTNNNGAPFKKINTKVFVRDLKVGSVGSDVKDLQQFLIKENSGPKAKILGQDKSTNYFGKLTKDALIEYQKAHSIKPASGYFGPKTRKLINQ